MTACRRAWITAAGLPVALAVSAALAWDSPTPMAPVPEHSCRWVETRKPDIHAVFLWKFTTEEDRAGALDELLSGDDLSALLETDDASLLGGAARSEAVEPTLAAGARVKSGIGRFGGGLELDGAGRASCRVPLAALLNGDGGLTLDFWFRPAGMPTASAYLFVFGDLLGQPLLSAMLTPDRQVVLRADDTPRLAVPLRDTADGWHHFAFIIDNSRGHLPFATMVLTVDGETAAATLPSHQQPVPWMQGVLDRLGDGVTVGAPSGETGLAGVVDEVLLARGVRRTYPWDLGVQERERRDPDRLALRAPFFRQGDVLTRFHFDGDLAPEAFAGRSWAGNADASHFQPGLNGQALDLSHIDETGFEMKGFYTIPETNGTIEFWFRPLDWDNFYVGEYDGRDVPFTWLMTLTSKEALYGTATKNIEARRGRACRDMSILWEKIHPGTWTHVLISIANGSPTPYVNGKRQKQWQVGLVLRGHPHSREPLQKWRERTGGQDVDDTWTLAFVKSPTLVDEFSVYSWPMNAEEAWNAYARWLPDEVAATKPLPVFDVDFDYVAHSWDMREKLNIDVTCLPVDDVQPASADCELRNAEGALLLAVERQALEEGGTTTFTVNQALLFGRYSAVVRSRGADGRVLKEEKLEYVRERPEWLGNTLGEERTVPAPWTPIDVRERTLGVIGREIDLGSNGLPARIETLGRDILAARVTVRASGVELTGRGISFGEVAPDRVAWTARLAGGRVEAELEGRLEFDGLVYVAVNLRGSAVDALTVDFPLDAEEATQMLANGGGSNFRASWIAKPIPEGQGSVWNSLDKPYPAFVRAHGLNNFMPHIWVGGDGSGLYFGGENDQGWTVNTNTPAQEIVREDGAVVFRMNVIREPTPIGAQGHRFHFVILPTPAKPEPPDWRYQMLAGGVNFGSCDTFGGFDMKTDPADPSPGDSFRLEPRSWEHAAAQAPQCRAKWGRCILYADASWPGLGPNFHDWRHDMWAGTGRVAWTPEFEDYAVWAVNEFLTRGLIDGVYWDDVSVGYTYSLASTAYAFAGSENGRRVGFTALAQRRVNMRLWRLFQAAGKEPCIWAHMTVCYEVPLFSFCRYLSNCEFVTGVDFPGKRDAMDVWSPDTLRILGGSAKWGTGYHNLSTLPRSLPDSAAAKQWLYPQARTETALYVTSDTMTPADGLGRRLVEEHIFDGAVRAYPWWNADEVLDVSAPTGAAVRASAYVLSGRVIAVVANWDRKERDVTVQLKPEAFRWAEKGVAWRDLDPGLEPPEAAVASAEEMAAVQAGAGQADLLGETDATGDVAIEDLLDGTTPEERAQDRLNLRTERDGARVLVRPRDYRVLEARPR